MKSRGGTRRATAVVLTGAVAILSFNAAHAAPVPLELLDLRVNRDTSLRFAVAGDQLLFPAGDNNTSGRELYVSDGTPSGSHLLKDLNTSGGSTPAELTTVGDTVFFAATNLKTGRELYKSDGTAAGTTIVRNIVTTTPASVENGESSSPIELSNVNGTLYFRAFEDPPSVVNRQLHLMRSDGTQGGTVRATELNSGDATQPTFSNGRLYFSNPTFTQLWVRDAAGTRLLKQIWNESSLVGQPVTRLTDIGGTLYFNGNDYDHGSELWVSDGSTGGTKMLADINTDVTSQGGGSSSPGTFAAIGSSVYFRAQEHLGQNSRIWKTQGTAATTARASDLATSSALIPLGGRLLFAADDGGGGQELWSLDDATGITSVIIDINPNGSSSPASLLLIDGIVYFSADDGTTGRELWQTDGTAEGTIRLADLNPGAGASNPINLTNFNGRLTFTAYDGVSEKLYILPEPTSVAFLVGLPLILARRTRPSGAGMGGR